MKKHHLVLAGIILLTSAPMARFMNKNIAGVSVPQDLIDEMASAPKGRAIEKGIEIAGRMIKKIRDEISRKYISSSIEGSLFTSFHSPAKWMRRVSSVGRLNVSALFVSIHPFVFFNVLRY